MENKGEKQKKTKQYSSVFWVFLRTGGIGLAAAIAGIVFLFIETIPESAMIPMMVLAGAIILAPYIVFFRGGRAEPFDETVQKSRYEALSLSANFFVEILVALAFVLKTLEIYELKISTGAVLMFAVAVRCFLQCLCFEAIESRNKQDAEAPYEDAITEGEDAF